MRHPISKLLLAVPALLLVHLLQDPVDELPVIPPFERMAKEHEAAVLEGLPGAWRLTFIERPDIIIDPANLNGYLIVVDGYLSMNLRIRGRDKVLENWVIFVQTVVARWRLDEFGRLQTVSLNGHSDFLGELEYEAGNLREFRPRFIDENTLQLERPDGQVMTFNRLKEREFDEDLLSRFQRARSGFDEFDDE